MQFGLTFARVTRAICLHCPFNFQLPRQPCKLHCTQLQSPMLHSINWVPTIQHISWQAHPSSQGLPQTAATAVTGSLVTGSDTSSEDHCTWGNIANIIPSHTVHTVAQGPTMYIVTQEAVVHTIAHGAAMHIRSSPRGHYVHSNPRGCCAHNSPRGCYAHMQ